MENEKDKQQIKTTKSEDDQTIEEIKDLNDGVEAIIKTGNKISNAKNGIGFIIIGIIFAGLGLLFLALDMVPILFRAENGISITLSLFDVTEYIIPIAIGVFCIYCGIKSLRKNK